MCEEKLIDIGNGVKLATKITGDLEDPTILLASGSILNYQQYDLELLPKLENNLRTPYSYVQYNYTGIGSSSRLEGQFNFVTLADQQAKLLKELDIDSVHLFGYSKGSMVSQIMTAKYPNLVMSLAGLGSPNLANPEFLEASKEEFSIRYQNSLALKGIWLDKINKKNFQIVYDTLFVPTIFDKKVFELGLLEKVKNWWIRKRIKPMLMGTEIGNIAKLYKYYTEEVSDEEQKRYKEAVKSIEKPTLLIHGTNDNTIPISSSTKLSNWIKDSKFVKIPNMDHSEPIFMGSKAKLVMRNYAKFLRNL